MDVAERRPDSTTSHSPSGEGLVLIHSKLPLTVYSDQIHGKFVGFPVPKYKKHLHRRCHPVQVFRKNSDGRQASTRIDVRHKRGPFNKEFLTP